MDRPSYSSWPHSPVMAPVNIADLADENKSRQKKPRHRHSPAQLAALNELYEKNEHPSLDERTTLAGHLGMEIKTVNAWFQNKRASSKKRNRGPAQVELPPISTLFNSSSSSIANTPHQAELDEFVESDDLPSTTDHHLPQRYHPSLVPQIEIDGHRPPQQTFYAAHPDQQHVFAENDGMPRKMRLRPTAEQTVELRKLYNINPHPSKEEREELGDRIGMRYQSITNWFQNQRSLAKRKKEEDSETPIPALDSSRSSVAHLGSAHESRTFSAFPPATRHPSLALQPPPSLHLSHAHSYPPRSGGRSPSLPPPVHSRLGDDSVLSSPRRPPARRSSTPYSSAASLGRPRRTRPEPYQLNALKELFTRTSNPSIEERSALALEIGMDVGKVTNWFRNLRQTARKRAQRHGGEYDGDQDEDSSSGPHHDLSRSGSPSLRSSSSSAGNDVDFSMDLDDFAAHSDVGSEDEYQEAVTPPPEPSPSPPPSTFRKTAISHGSRAHPRDAGMRMLSMVVDATEMEKEKMAKFHGVKVEDALLLLSFHNHANN